MQETREAIILYESPCTFGPVQLSGRTFFFFLFFFHGEGEEGGEGRKVRERDAKKDRPVFQETLIEG